MKILILGSGGREHALTWKIAQSSRVNKIFVAPGNAGTASEPKTTNIAIAASDKLGLLQFAQAHKIDLTIVGPEQPLALGIVDLFKKNNLLIWGPMQFAAQLESSKIFSKSFMQRHNIPTAFYQSFCDSERAKAFIEKQKLPLVIKADGLASGKGVIIANTQAEAFEAVDSMLVQQRYGEAGLKLVIEEYLEGQEVSFIVMSDGKNIVPFETAQDYKRRDDDGKGGPNTGGMGAYSPTPTITSDMQKRILKEIVYPTLEGMKKEACAYVGFLYIGLMMTPTPKVLEFNCRLGDPEAQSLLFRLKNDLVTLCLQGLDEKLNEVTLEWDPQPAVGVVMASRPYPEDPIKGETIEGLDKKDLPNCKVFHAGTIAKGDHIVTDGGRVLCVCAKGETLNLARAKAYARVKEIHWKNVFYRSDIGHLI